MLKCLHVHQVLVSATQGYKLVVTALLYNLALVHDHYEVSILDGREAVCNHQRGAAVHEFVKSLLHQMLASSRMRMGGFLRMARAMLMR